MRGSWPPPVTHSSLPPIDRTLPLQYTIIHASPPEAAGSAEDEVSATVEESTRGRVHEDTGTLLQSGHQDVYAAVERPHQLAQTATVLEVRIIPNPPVLSSHALPICFEF